MGGRLKEETGVVMTFTFPEVSAELTKEHQPNTEGRVKTERGRVEAGVVEVSTADRTEDFG